MDLFSSSCFIGEPDLSPLTRQYSALEFCMRIFMQGKLLWANIGQSDFVVLYAPTFELKTNHVRQLMKVFWQCNTVQWTVWYTVRPIIYPKV